jgi:hypothetical protein
MLTEREGEMSFDQNDITLAVDTDAEIHDSPLAPQVIWKSCMHI